jgi:hypothetical protein
MAEWGEPVVADVGSAGKDRSDEIVPKRLQAKIDIK